MSQISDIKRVWVFNEAGLEAALDAYVAEAKAAYPQQEERIRITALAMRDFLYSRHADQLTLDKKPHQPLT
jgi:hypothetical protein